MASISYHGKPVHDRVAQLLRLAADAVQCPSFVLYGGCVIDSAINRDAHVNDLDIMIFEPDLVRVRSALARGHFTEVSWDINFFTRNTVHLSVGVATKNGMTYDINTGERYSDLALWTAESLMCSYPEFTFIDPHNAVGAVESGTLNPVCQFSQDNPTMFLLRLIKLASKYGLSLSLNETHVRHIVELNSGIESWRSPGERYDAFFHRVNRLWPAIHLLAILAKSETPYGFLEDIVAANALKAALPELHQSLLCEIPSEPLRMLQAGKERSELLYAFLLLTNGTHRDTLAARLREFNLGQ